MESVARAFNVFGYSSSIFVRGARPKGCFSLHWNLLWKEVLTEAVTTAINVTPLVTALTTSVTPADVVALLAVVIGAGMGFVLVWFGSRKVTSGFMGALKKGKLRI